MEPGHDLTKPRSPRRRPAFLHASCFAERHAMKKRRSNRGERVAGGGSRKRSTVHRSEALRLRPQFFHHRGTEQPRYARPQPNGCKEEARTAERCQRVAGGRRQATAGVQTFDPRAPRRGARTGVGRRFLAPLRGARTPERFASGGVAALHRRLPSSTPPACTASKRSSPAAQKSDVSSTEDTEILVLLSALSVLSVPPW